MEYQYECFDVIINYKLLDQEFAIALAMTLMKLGLHVWHQEPQATCPPPRLEGTFHIEDYETIYHKYKSLIIIIGYKGLSKKQAQSCPMNISYKTSKVIPILLYGVPKNEIPKNIYYNCNPIILTKEYKKLPQSIIDDIFNRITDKKLDKWMERPKIFLCHAKEDSYLVKQLSNKLREYGINPWFDEEKLIIGDRWEKKIIYAIENTDFFGICISRNSILKQGFIQNEIKIAIREYQKRPSQYAFLLPIRLEDCEIPKLKVSDNTYLNDFVWIDLFNNDNKNIIRFVDGIKRQYIILKT